MLGSRTRHETNIDQATSAIPAGTQELKLTIDQRGGHRVRNVALLIASSGLVGGIIGAEFTGGGSGTGGKTVTIPAARVYQVSKSTLDCRAFSRTSVDAKVQSSPQVPGGGIPGIKSVVRRLNSGIAKVDHIGAEFEGPNGKGGGEVDMFTCIPASADNIKTMPNGLQEIIINTSDIREIAYPNEGNSTTVQENSDLVQLGTLEWNVLGSLNIASGIAHSISIKQASAGDIARAAAVNEATGACAVAAFPKVETAAAGAIRQIQENNFATLEADHSKGYYKPFNAKMLKIEFEGAAPDIQTYTLPPGFRVSPNSSHCEVSSSAYNPSSLENIQGQPIGLVA